MITSGMRAAGRGVIVFPEVRPTEGKYGRSAKQR